MKRSLFIFGMLLAGTTFFASCTKDLKDDVKDLQGRVNEVEHLIGSNEPANVTTTFTDDDNATRTVTGAYKIKSSNLSTQYIIKDEEDGTYEVYIKRLGELHSEESVTIKFIYNPTTKAITEKQVYHEWEDIDNNYGNFSFFYDGFGEDNSITITLDKLDVNTGDVSLKVAASGNSDYTSELYGPNPGQPVSTTIAFTGKLKVYERED